MMKLSKFLIDFYSAIAPIVMIKRTAEKLPIEQKTIQTVLTSMISLILNMDPVDQHQEERPKSSKYILI